MSIFSGNEHQVITGVCVISSNKKLFELVESSVLFCKLNQEQIQSYWETGEPINKSGGYAIQGLASNFITSISGSYSSIVGLPMVESRFLLNKQGLFGDF